MNATIERDHEIIHNGFSSLVKTPGLFFCIVCERNGYSTDFAVYMRHGSPGGQFWLSARPIRRFKDISEARKIIDEMAGLVDAHKSFPIFHRN